MDACIVEWTAGGQGVRLRLSVERLGLWVFSAAVCAMSAPDGKSGKAYQWLYRFSHLLAANLDRVDVIGNPDEEAATARQHN